MLYTFKMQRLFKKIWSNEFYQGGIFLTFSSFGINILNYFFNLLAGRALGPIGFGEISTLFSYITILSIPTAIVSTIIIQKIGGVDTDKDTYAQSLEHFMTLKIKKFGIFLLPIFLIIPFLPYITNLSPITSYILIPEIIFSVLASIYTSLLQGLKLFLVFSVISFLATIIKLSGSVLAVFHIGGIGTVLLFLILSAIWTFIACFYILHYRVHSNKKLPEDKKIQKRLLHILLGKQFIITALSIAAITILNNVDIIYVKKFFPSEQAGLYSSWALFARAIFYVLGPLLGLSYIFFTNTKSADNQNKSFLFSFAALCILGIFSYLFYSFFAPTIINVFFGHKFSAIIPFLGQASIYGSLYAMITFINNFFIARKSSAALIIVIMIPLYIVGLFFIPQNIATIFYLNLIFAFSTVLLYIVAFFKKQKSSIFRY